MFGLQTSAVHRIYTLHEKHRFTKSGTVVNRTNSGEDACGFYSDEHFSASGRRMFPDSAMVRFQIVTKIHNQMQLLTNIYQSSQVDESMATQPNIILIRLIQCFSYLAEDAAYVLPTHHIT